jgi:uncharacterized membrane protein
MALDQMQDEPTIGKLVVDAQRDISKLISDEIKLAKSEIKVSVKAGGFGIGFFAAAGFLAVLGIIMASVTIAYFIHWNGAGLDLHWAYLIVTAFWFLLAGILAFLGIRSVKRVRGPERAIAQAKQNSQAFKRS